MTPKEKADQMVDKFVDTMFDFRDGRNYIEIFETGIKQALILAKEIKTEFVKALDYERASYWRLVEQEIKKQ